MTQRECFDLSTEVEFASHPPEMRGHLLLRVEVLTRAILDASGQTSGIRKTEERIEAKREAREWLESNLRGDMTFLDVCEALDLNSQTIRDVAKLVIRGTLELSTLRSEKPCNKMERLFG